MNALLRGVVPLLASHLEIVLVALGAAAVISLPLAVAAIGRPRLAFTAVTIAGVIQTIPGLALLALMVPLLSMTGWLSPFGFPPAVIALTLYAVLPILRNGVTGLRGVDPAVVDAARGMGMAPWQIMQRVQLPLAAPVIAAGIRTSAVWTVGIATLATPVGQTCLGNYIFTGLQTRNFAMLLVGVAAAAMLALILDALLAAAERALAARAPRRALLPAGLLALFAVLVIGVLPTLATSARAPLSAEAATASAQAAITHVRIGGKTFTEQYILVELMRARLEAAGIKVETAQGLGSTVIFDALAHNDIDVYVEYSGTLWTNAIKGQSGLPRWQVLQEIDGWLARGFQVRSLGSLGFENAYTLAVRRDTATRLELHTLADLARYAGTLAIGGDYEFFGRQEWASLQRAYQPQFKRTVTFDPTLLYEAIARNQVDVISAFSSDGRIAANDLVVLGDPLAALPPYDAMILLAPRVANDPRVLCALGDLRISVESMRYANAMVDRDKLLPAAAAAWLLQHLSAGGPACDRPAS